MAKTLTLCQDVGISFDSSRWDKSLYITLWLLGIKSQLPQRKTMLRMKKVFEIYSINWWRYFWLSIFRCSTHCRRNLMGYLESWWNSEQETCSFYVKIVIWKFGLILTWPWPDFRRVRLDVIAPNDCHHRYLRARWPRKPISRHVCDFTLLWPFVNWPWPF